MATQATTDSVVGSGAELIVAALQPQPLPIRPVASAPCTQACPAGVNVKAYVSLIAEGRFAEALEEVRRRCTLPSVCGRICHAPCEPACRRSEAGGPVAIRALKRFVADVAPAAGDAPGEGGPDRDERVAVVGSGPAGLTAAADLRRAGHPVTVLEGMPQPGGMLRYGVADYRLPPDVLDAEIDLLLADGIDLQTGVRIDTHQQISDLQAEGYAAVLLAIGVERGRNLGIPGEEEGAVEDALGFLRRVNEGDRAPLSGRVVVVGGGSTAVEAARTALRLGASPVDIVYRRSRSELPAGDEEIVQAEREGIGFRFLAAPQRIMAGEGGLEGLECVETALGEPDASGRRRPVPVAGSEFLVEADKVLVAVGQEATLDFVSPDTAETMIDRGLLVADPATAMTRWEGVFAAGDVVSGPSTVIEAIASGHEAAESIARYLESGTPEIPSHVAPTTGEYGLPDPAPDAARRIDPEVAGLTPGGEFSEVEQPYTEADAVAEASRCLRCGPCSECRTCSPSCDRRHLLLDVAVDGATVRQPWLPLRVPSEVALRLGSNGAHPGELAPAPGDSPHRPVDVLPVRVDYVAERCRGCARCLEVCQFDALRLTAPTDPESKVAFEPTACRGCALCTAVCPTAALTAVAHSPDWWTRESTGKGLERPHVVVACDPLPLLPDEDLGSTDPAPEVIACRCVGQVHPGMLLELSQRGANRITVAACADCRFGAGPRLAQQHVAEVRALLRALGEDESTVTLRPVDRAGAPAGGAR